MKRKPDAMDAAGLQTQAQPELTTRMESVCSTAGTISDIPTHYIRHKVIPCKFCRRTHCEAGLAVVTRSIRKQVAYLRSRCCGRNWSLPVKEM